MSQNNEEIDCLDNTEEILPYRKLRGFVDRILRKRLSKASDVEDVSQNVFQRSWQWTNKKQ